MRFKGITKKNIWLFIIIAGFITELVIFNFRSFESLFISERQYPIEMLDVQDMTDYGQGVYKLTGDDGTGIIYIWKLDELMGDVPVRNIRIDAQLPQAVDTPASVSGIMKMERFIRDEGHDRYFQLSEHVYRPDVADSHYMWLQSAGQMKTLTLKISLSEGDVLQIASVTVNAQRPFDISPLRLLIIYGILAVVYLMRASSRIWKEDAVTPDIRKTVAAVLTGAVLILPAVFLDANNGSIWTQKSFQPYQLLAEAFAAGQLHLLETPPEEFAEMENPYDYGARAAAGLQMDTDYLWDTAYYEGKYYCYFGVVPCVLFYLPVYLISGKHLHDAVLTLILAVFIYAGIYLLIREWIKRNKATIPFAYLIMMSVMVFLGSGLPIVMADPDAHDVPRVLGLALVIWGLYLWMSSARSDKKGLYPVRLAAGSLLMALSVGCRPNQALWSFMALPLFADYLRCDKEGYGSKERTRAVAALLLPYIPVAAGLMIYNALRFGSVTDFGIAYNLTVMDYGQDNFSVDRLVTGLFEFLFGTPALTYHFPYVREQSFIQLNELGHGYFYYTVNYGGLFTTNLLLWCLPGLFCDKKKDLSGIMMIILGMADLIFNSCLAGVAYHYRLDFAVLFLLAAALGAEKLGSLLKGTAAEKWFGRFLIMALVLSILYHGCLYLSPSLMRGNTGLYYTMLYSCL